MMEGKSNYRNWDILMIVLRYLFNQTKKTYKKKHFEGCKSVTYENEKGRDKYFGSQ